MKINKIEDKIKNNAFENNEVKHIFEYKIIKPTPEELTPTIIKWVCNLMKVEINKPYFESILSFYTEMVNNNKSLLQKLAEEEYKANQNSKVKAYRKFGLSARIESIHVDTKELEEFNSLISKNRITKDTYIMWKGGKVDINDAKQVALQHLENTI